MKNKGFTLIEIIIVIIILGILAGLALPKLSGSINKGRAPEGLETIGKLAREISLCYQIGNLNNLSVCDSWTDLNYSGLSAEVATNNFTYALTTGGGGVVVRGVCPSPICNPPGTIDFTISSTGASVGLVTNKGVNGGFQGLKLR